MKNRMNKKLNIIWFLVTFVIVLDTPGFAKIGYSNAENGLNIRIKGNEDAEVINKLSYGTEIKIIKEGVGRNREWTKIMIDDLIGYIHSDYIQEENPFDEMEYLGNWHITAYAATGSPCANGNMPTVGYTVACNSLDFGTEIYIKDVGFRMVEDRGPGWLGSEWCDIYLGNTQDCVNWGTQYKDVYLVKENEK